MASKRNRTNSDATPDWTLSEQQRTAIDLLVTGRNIQDTADSVGVARPTVSAWLHHSPIFQAALNQRRQELWQDVTDALRALAPAAVEVLKRELEGEEPLAAAVHLLKCLGLYGMSCVPQGPTDPRVLAAAAQSAEDAAQHAEADATLAARRKAHYRAVDNLNIDLSGVP